MTRWDESSAAKGPRIHPDPDTTALSPAAHRLGRRLYQHPGNARLPTHPGNQLQKVTCEHEWDVVSPCPECGTDAFTNRMADDTAALLQRIRDRLAVYAEPHEREALVAIVDEEVARW